LKLFVLGCIVLWQICTLHQYEKLDPVSAYAILWVAEPANISISRGYCNNPNYDWGDDFTDEEAATAGKAEAFGIQCLPLDRAPFSWILIV
jgi:hypothetical protein